MPFIKNEKDYDQYRNQKGFYSKKLERNKVKFICSVCGKESIRTFRTLTKDFICSVCNNRKAQNRIETKNKIKQTFIKNYGVDNPQKNKAIQEKRLNTWNTFYKDRESTKYKEMTDKRRNTMLKKFGVEYPYQNIDIFKKSRDTLFKNYGVDSPFDTITMQKLVSGRILEKYNIDNSQIKFEPRITLHDLWLSLINTILKSYNIELLDIKNNIFHLYCHSCNIEFNYTSAHFYRLLKLKKSFCPHCSRIKDPVKSFAEKEFSEYIRKIYTGIILENDRVILNGKELDIYLPDLKLAFEFDGTYWHADPRFYTEKDFILNQSVKEIWAKDIEKNNLCESSGIILIREKEYDWNNNQDEEKLKIKTIIDNLTK